MKIEYEPIGVIRSPFVVLSGMPVQSAGALSIKGTVELFPEFIDGLKDLEGFSHLILLYHFHQSKGFDLQLVPFLDNSSPRGLFATRAPRRPNPIGLSVVKLLDVQDSVLHLENVDILDGTPLLDIKPYVPEFDGPATNRIGWYQSTVDTVSKVTSDTRFSSR